MAAVDDYAHRGTRERGNRECGSLSHARRDDIIHVGWAAVRGRTNMAVVATPRTHPVAARDKRQGSALRQKFATFRRREMQLTQDTRLETGHQEPARCGLNRFFVRKRVVSPT